MGYGTINRKRVEVEGHIWDGRRINSALNINSEVLMRN